MNLKDRFRQAREEKGLSQEDIASLVGVSQNAISKIESGVTLRPKHILKYAEELGVTIEWLSYGQEPKYLLKNKDNVYTAFDKKNGVFEVKERKGNLYFMKEHEYDLESDKILKGFFARDDIANLVSIIKLAEDQGTLPESTVMGIKAILLDGFIKKEHS